MNFKTFLQHHPVASYFGMTFMISWVGVFLVVAPRLMRGEAISTTDGLLMFPVLLLGPSITGITLTAIVDGKSGLRNLFSRMGRWRVGAHWYGVLLIPPVFILAVLLTMKTLISPVYTPHLFLMGILFGLAPGVLEEIGWSGYAFPKMQVKYGTLPATCLLGILWGLWHAPVVDFMGAAYPHGASWLPFYLAFITLVMAIRVLIVWVYSHTQSVLLAQLLHASSTGFLVILSPSPISPTQEVLWYAVYAAILWIAVAGVVKYDRGLVQPTPHVQVVEPAINK